MLVVSLSLVSRRRLLLAPPNRIHNLLLLLFPSENIMNKLIHGRRRIDKRLGNSSFYKSLTRCAVHALWNNSRDGSPGCTAGIFMPSYHSPLGRRMNPVKPFTHTQKSGFFSLSLENMDFVTFEKCVWGGRRHLLGWKKTWGERSTSLETLKKLCVTQCRNRNWMQDETLFIARK